MAVVLIFVLHVQGSCQDRTPDWIVLEDLDAAFHQGCAHLTFSFRDVERSKHVSDLTDALDSSFDESHVIASQGSLAYWGPKEWWRITSEPTAIQFDGTVLTDGPVDLAANKGAFFVHRPTVQLTAERKSRDVFAIRPLGEQTGAFPDIINVQLLEKWSLLEYLQPGVKRGSDFPFEWNQKDGLIEISARDGKLPVTRSLTISTEGPFPSVVRREETAQMPSGQEVKLVQALFDFVKLDNGMKVPSRIHSYYGPLPEQQDAYFIQQWRGTYTGEAKSEDFVMEMSVDVRIDVADENVQRQIKDQIVGHSGLFNVYEFVEGLGVDLVDSKTSATSLGMSDRDIVSVYDGSVDNVEPAEKSTLSSILRSLFVCFGLVAIISFLMAIWMRRSRYSIESES